MAHSVYKSSESRDKFRDYYRNVLGRLPFGQQYVETAFGRTFLLTAGQDSNPPIILLHGACSNSASWFQEMTALSENYRAYAVDIVGEAGNSEEFRPDLRSDAFALWMKDVLDALGIDHAVFIGNSLGGWTALKFAAAFPERVSKVVLIASAGISQIRPQYLSDVAQARREDGTVPMTPEIIGEQSMPKAVLDFVNLIIESYNPIQELPLYTDEQLRRLNMPVLFIAGEDDVIIDSAESAQRLTSLVPSAEIHVLPHCGHVVFNALSIIIPFLEKEA